MPSTLVVAVHRSSGLPHAVQLLIRGQQQRLALDAPRQVVQPAAEQDGRATAEECRWYPRSMRQVLLLRRQDFEEVSEGKPVPEISLRC
jgi:hypothetical protein